MCPVNFVCPVKIEYYRSTIYRRTIKMGNLCSAVRPHKTHAVYTVVIMEITNPDGTVSIYDADVQCFDVSNPGDTHKKMNFFF